MSYYKVNDINLYYEVKGEPTAKGTIAFLNGVMASVSSWNFQVPIFEKMGYKIVLHDFKGQHLSDKPEGVYTLQEHAAEAKALFEHLGVERLHLIGTSYGGEVAMRMAIDYPEMVQSISVIDSVSELDEVLTLFIKSWKELAEKADPEAFFWGMAPSIYGHDFLKNNLALLTERAEIFKSYGPEYFKGQISLYDTFLQSVTMTDELAKIECPALIICGSEDILKPYKFSKIIADNIPNSEFLIIPDSGHVTIFEKYEALNSALLGFIIKNSLR
ncbi:MAG: alpha/beta hydrolase [Peptococcia bacterium]